MPVSEYVSCYLTACPASRNTAATYHVSAPALLNRIIDFVESFSLSFSISPGLFGTFQDDVDEFHAALMSAMTYCRGENTITLMFSPAECRPTIIRWSCALLSGFILTHCLAAMTLSCILSLKRTSLVHGHMMAK
jgi:hypothetical protein